MSGLLLAWAVEAGIVTWRSFAKDHRPPLPSEFVSTFVVFGVLGAIAEIPNARTLATVTAWGIVLATALNYADPASGTIGGKTLIGYRQLPPGQQGPPSPIYAST